MEDVDKMGRAAFKKTTHPAPCVNTAVRQDEDDIRIRMQFIFTLHTEDLFRALLVDDKLAVQIQTVVKNLNFHLTIRSKKFEHFNQRNTENLRICKYFSELYRHWRFQVSTSRFSELHPGACQTGYGVTNQACVCMCEVCKNRVALPL